jgi:SIT family siderophore-iron:H+ symporter-like MFS transporter
MEHVQKMQPLAVTPTRDEKDDSPDLSPTKSFCADEEASVTDSESAMVTAKSRGVFDMEMLSSRLNTKYKIALYGGFALLAYCLSLGRTALSPIH